MRVIKFRGKRLDNGEWEYGSLLYTDDGYCRIMKSQYFWCIESIPVDPNTVGQFTGLTDRKGEEIYEGDILVIDGIKYPRHYVVSWNEEKLMFCIGETPLYAMLEAGNTQIREYNMCGNVHDNHKLLEKGGEK